MGSQLTDDQRRRGKELTRKIQEGKKDFKAKVAKMADLADKFSDIKNKLMNLEKEARAEEDRKAAALEARRALGLLELELAEVAARMKREATLLAEEVGRGREAAEELRELAGQCGVVEAREREQVMEVERAEVAREATQKARTRLQETLAKLTRKRDGLGGLVPALLERHRGVGRTELARQLAEVLHKIGQATEVNQKADDQFVTFSAEKTRLTHRHEELVANKEMIVDMINVLDTQRGEQILYTYRQLYRNFSAVFEELVPVGRAELLLTGCPAGDSDEGQLEAATS